MTLELGFRFALAYALMRLALPTEVGRSEIKDGGLAFVILTETTRPVLGVLRLRPRTITASRARTQASGNLLGDLVILSRHFF